MTSRIRTIAIVGGGFSGTVLAADLLAEPGSTPLQVLLIERRRELGRGVAYAKGDFPFVLNVPASRMSVDAAKPLDFVRFAAERHPELAGQAFLPREVYGEYLQDVLARAQADAPRHARLRRIEASAERVLRLRSGRLVVQLSNREQLIADEVVLACGDPPPVLPAVLHSMAHDERVVGNPYGAQIPYEKIQDVLLLGSGLTMCDFAVAAASFNSRIRIHALSRHGLMPAAQTAAAAHVSDADLSAILRDSPRTARGLVSGFRAVLRRTLSRGGDWRDAIGIARTLAPALWSLLPVVERARFLRHVRPYWDVHRHRVPAATAHRIEQLRRAGQFELSAGRLLDIRAVSAPGGTKLEVRFQTRGDQSIRTIQVDRIVNCTGAYGRISETRDPLLKTLLSDGTASVDANGLGLEVGACGELIDAQGRAAADLHYVGPMLRATQWEATAAGELRQHVARLASVVRSSRQRPETRAQVQLAAHLS